MISAYTDASVSNNTAVVSCVVLSDDSFIGYDYHTFSGVSRSFVAEILGVMRGISYLRRLDVDINGATIYTDSDKVMQLLHRPSERLKGSTGRKIKHIKKQCGNYGISVKHCVGHQHNSNPNNIADRICNSVMRSQV